MRKQTDSGRVICYYQSLFYESFILKNSRILKKFRSLARNETFSYL